MPRPNCRHAAFVPFLVALCANAQLSVPPATYQPQPAARIKVESELLLPAEAPARHIELGTPTAEERDTLKPGRTAGPSRNGITPQQRALAIGFARHLSPSTASFSLSDLAWSRTDVGANASHITLTSPGAAAIRLGLVLTGAPATLEIRFKGNAGAETFGPYPAAIASGPIYWSPVLEGDTAIIELTLPAGSTPSLGTVSLPMISHLVLAGKALRQADPLGNIGASDSCEVDVACLSPTVQQQAATAINAVARMVFTNQGRTGLCSGTLINDATASFTPYFFIANHCIDNDELDVGASKARPATVASSINTYWFFQTSVCGRDTASNVNFALITGGAKLLGRSPDFDWGLVRLNHAPPAGATFAAWNASPLSTFGTPADGIHHPEGDLKKVSQGTTQGFEILRGGASFVGVRWTQGATEPGSSGSGLFTYNASQNYYELRGALYAGDSACDPAHRSEPDFYSRIDVALPLVSQYLTANAANPAKKVLVVEFYNATLDDYFITANSGEIQDLDNGVHVGWLRTGLTFLAYSDPSVAPPGAHAVCRFYVLPKAGDSHFYSADERECADTAVKFAGTWVQESPALFYILLPDKGTGGCPANTRAVFRFLNDRNGLHHRYTTEVTVRDATLYDGGWTLEGYGNPPAQTVMCSPTS